ncbi:MAG TPA: bacterial transcriptional activator domain-containing protein, partial [Gammaproteobacteria bacterium]|nr:bacterial transcriptional activator domain-containing protein [Gammaproteobacteria bacterium]
QIDGEFPSPQVEGIVTSTMFGSLVWRQPQHPKFHYWRERCLQFLPHISDVSRRIEQMCFIAGADMMLGKDAEAACLIEQARNEMKSHKVSPLARILYRFAAAFNAWRAGFTRLAVEHAFAGLTIADRSGVHMYDYQLRNQGATGALSDGDLKTSAKLLEVPDVQFEANLGIKGSYYEYIAAWHTALKGETARALERARHAVELGVKAGTPFFEGLAHFGLSNVLHDVGDRSEASRELEVALALARRIGSQIIEFAGLMHKAWFAFEEERNADGLNHLRAALNIGASHDYYNFSWSRPPVMARLCAEALQANIETEYVQDLIRRRQLVPKKPPFEIANWPWPVKLTTLGQFEINLDDKPVVFSRKAPKKVITLLKAIIAYGGHDVPAGRLTDALWPDEEADAAHEAFAINLHRLRKLIGDDVVLLQEGRITLSAHRCWLDTWAFERLLDQAKAADTASERVALMEKALSLYHGSFLAGDSEEPWALSARERLRAKFIRHAVFVGQCLTDAGKWQEAADYYLRGIEADNLAEEFYQGVMRCYVHLNRHAEGLAIYRRLQRTLSIILGIAPSPASQALYKSLRTEEPLRSVHIT